VTRALIALLALTLAFPAAAPAADPPRSIAPPGNSGVDEYRETVPGDDGDHPTNPGNHPSNGRDGLSVRGGGSSHQPVTATQRHQLERLGPDGRTLAAVVDATSPPTTHKRRSIAGSGRSPVIPVVEVAFGRDGSGGLGALLPAVLLVSALGVVVLRWRRHRRPPS
jgi:hypothetical protein